MGNSMRTTHYTRLILIVVWQLVMVAALLYSDSSPHRWIPSVFAISALLVPFISYIASVYDAPLFVKWSRVLKAAVLTLCSFVCTIIGYLVLFIVGRLLNGVL